MSTGTAIAFNLLAAELIAVGIGAQKPFLIVSVLALAWMQSGFRVRKVLGRTAKVLIGT
jgi:hypothetical protein